MSYDSAALCLLCVGGLGFSCSDQVGLITVGG